MSNEKGVGLDAPAIANYHAEGMKAQDGYNPDQGFRRPTPGRHKFVIDGKACRFLEFQDCKWKGIQYQLHQLWVQLRFEDGSSIMDFIHIPTFDPRINSFSPMDPQQESRWGQFMKAIGFNVTQDNLWPPGFRLAHLDGRRGECEIVVRTDKDGKVEKAKDGTDDVQVKLFGYYSPTGDAKPVAMPSPAPSAAAAPEPQKPKYNL